MHYIMEVIRIEDPQAQPVKCKYLHLYFQHKFTIDNFITHLV